MALQMPQGRTIFWTIALATLTIVIVQPMLVKFFPKLFTPKQFNGSAS